MIGWMLGQAVPWKMRRLRYPDQGEPSAKANTEEVIESFLIAAKASFEGANADDLMTLERDIPWNRRTFFWEGHAFGVTGRLACSFSGKNSSDEYLAPGYRYMLYTGLGVWNGLSGCIYGPQLSQDPARWASSPDWEGCRSLTAGGVSFSRVVFDEQVSQKNLERIAARGDEWWARGVWQGAGRAAWFLYMRNPKRITQLLEAYGPHADAIAEGLGIAITFTQLAEPHRILEQIEALPARFRPPLMLGSRLCLGAASIDDPRALPTLEALPAPLNQWMVQGRQVVLDAGSGADMTARISAGLYALL